MSIEEKSKVFVELLEKRKKHFAALRAQEKRNKPPTKAQKRNTMSTYLKNMAGYRHNQLKSKSYDEIQEMFDKEMKRVNTFVDMNTELVKCSKTRAEGSSKRAGDELEEEKAKKQKGDDDQEEEEMKKHMEIVQDDEMLQNIDREDLKTLWKLVKAKHRNTRPEEAYERVLWGDLKVMFEHDIKNSDDEHQVYGRIVGFKRLQDILRVTAAQKPTGSEGFQEIVDFLNGSHIRFALTKNPTIYVSLIEKFWQTATVRTVDNGEQEISALVDGKEFTIY
ncbi:hypothetical protein Tco_0596561 [Tanacetum coccineum]